MSKWALVTGPTSGIGYELSKQLAASGYNIFLVSRDTSQLKTTASELSKVHGIKTDFLACDLSIPKAAINVFSRTESRGYNINLLVNNAGFGNYGFFAETSIDTDLQLIELNISAITHLCKLYLPSMIKQRKGYILNIGSMASFLVGPYMNTYFASKAYVLSFSTALYNECKNYGVKVSCLCPGPTPSKFGERAHYGKNLHRRISTPVTFVAQQGIKGLLKGKAIIIPGFKNRVMINSARLFPKVFVAYLVRKLSGY
jgi:uncharacterized protein